MSTRVYGASDDLIEFEGDVSGEIGHYSERPARVFMSDGTQLSVLYGKPNHGGVWLVKVIHAGPLFDHLEECSDEDAKIYSDIAHFKDGLTGARHKGKAVR